MTAVASAPRITLGEVARQIGCDIWCVRRLFERGLLPPAPRIGAWRIVSPDDVPAIRAAAIKAGYVTAVEDGNASADPVAATNLSANGTGGGRCIEAN